MHYTQAAIVLNNQRLPIREILKHSSFGKTPFETGTLMFIKKWLEGVQTFTLHTSGSTGTPKEITLTREQLQQSALRTAQALKLSAGNTALVCVDTKYIAGKMMLVRALETNMNIVAVEPASNPFKNIPATTSIDFTALVPLQLEEILKDNASTEKLNCVKNIIIGGAAVSENLKSKIRNLKSTVYATYGMTETVSHIALQKLNGVDAQHCFETLPDINIKTDKRGCLVIDLPGFRDPIITNDIVTHIDESHFTIAGRYDNIINSGGIKLIPESIELKIRPLLPQHDFFVAGIDDERLGQKLVLIIEGISLPHIAETLKPVLSAYENPKEIFFLEQFVRTATGKINRVKTLEKALESNR